MEGTTMLVGVHAQEGELRYCVALDLAPTIASNR